jgi:transposase InsO family protein
MLNDKEYEELCLSLNWTAEAREIVNRIRKSAPARLVRSRRKNVSGRYPSRKMGLTIQFDSHTCELPVILDMEYYQEDVLEFYDQPLSFPIQFENKNNRKINPLYTPDFFVIRKTGAEFIECKTEEELVKLSNKHPSKYVLGKYGVWQCPPVEQFAAKFGFQHRVISTAEIDRVQIRNTVFLEDYLGEDTPKVSEQSQQKILSFFGTESRITLSDLLNHTLEAKIAVDDVYIMIATGNIYVDLRAEPLVERTQVWVYPSQESAKAYATDHAEKFFPKASYIEIKEGARIIWNNRVLNIIHVGDTKIYFEGENGAAPAITFSYFEELLKRGELQGVQDNSEADADFGWKKRLNEANTKCKAEALRREAIVKAHLRCEPLQKKVALRTLARWKAHYLLAERLHGNGLVGLLPNWHLRGDRKTQRLSPEAHSIMKNMIENDYETIVQKGMFVVWGKVVLECKRSEPSIKHPSYVTFIRYVKLRPRHLQTLKRMGHRAAYGNQPFYYWLDKDTPPHGDRPMEICHIDHTELDIELVDSKTGENLGRPWVSFMVCAKSRRIAAAYLTFDPPSIRSDMMLIRECVRRTGRLPQIIVVDGGSDLHSIYFETLMAAFEITVKTRPAAEPRFGSPIERLFYTTKEQFIRTKLGNTQIMRNVRQVTKTNNPKRLAVWTIGSLYQALYEWAYECYETEKHSILQQTPREVYFSGIKFTGERRHRWISYDEEFKVLTLPPTRKGTAKNQVGKGVKIFSRYYWCDDLGKEEFEDKQLEVRFDPFNISIAYVFLKNRWVKCLSDRHLDLQGRTAREQKVISEEERRRERLFSQDMASRGIKRALKAMNDEKKEKELAEQLRILRRQQRENASILNAINGSSFSADSRESAAASIDRGSPDDSRPQGSSLFSGIDTSKLGSLDTYRG